MITAAQLFDYLKITRENWVTATYYEKGQYRTNSSTVYECLVNHTSGTFATDLTAGKWTASHFVQSCADYAINRVNTHLNRDCRSASYTDKFKGDGSNVHWLDNPPGSAVASIELRDESTGEYATIFTGTDTIENSIELIDGKIELLKGYTFTDGSAYKVIYTGGFSSVPEAIIGVCRQIAGLYYKESPQGRDILGLTSQNIGSAADSSSGFNLEAAEQKALSSIDKFIIYNV